YVGFTGGSGGFTAVQDIETWTGTFAPPPVDFIAAPTYAACSAGSSVAPIANAVGDFNGDGIPALAVVDDNGQGFVSILLGKGDGSFQALRKYEVAYGTSSLAVGDFNGDGHLDVVSDSGSILFGNGDGTFQAAQSYGAHGFYLAVGDFNRD